MSRHSSALKPIADASTPSSVNSRPIRKAAKRALNVIDNDLERRKKLSDAERAEEDEDSEDYGFSESLDDASGDSSSDDSLTDDDSDEIEDDQDDEDEQRVAKKPVKRARTRPTNDDGDDE